VARGLGIEVNGAFVRALAVEGGKRPRILSFSEQVIDPDESRPWADRARDAVKAAVAAAGGARGRIAASVDSGEVVLRELQLPFTADDQLRKTVPFELEHHVHNHAIEDLVVDYVRTVATEKGSQLLVAGVPRKIVEERLALLESAGADPALLDLDSLALFNAIVAAGTVKGDAPILVVYGGSRFTKFLLIENGRPRSIRTIRYSPSVAEAAPSVDIPAKEEVSTGDEPYVIIEKTAPVDILAKEAGRFLMASGATGTPSHIYVAGNLDPDEVAGPLTETTGIPVEPLDLLSAFPHALPAGGGIERKVPVALGLALKAVDRDASGTDFRRDQFSYAKKFETVKSSALVFVDLVLMFLALVALHLHFKGHDLRARAREVLDYQVQIVADAVNHDPSAIPEPLQADPSKSLSFMKAKLEALEAEVGAGNHPIEHSALNLVSRIWSTLERFYQEYGARKVDGRPFFIQIDSANATQDPARGEASVALTGLAANTQLAENLKQMLQGAALFDNKEWAMETGPYRPDHDNTRFSFTLRKGRK
jgi:hypothetical protein